MPTVVGVRGVFLCAVVLLMLAFIATKPGLGDTITFQDIGDTVTVDTTSTRVSGISCEMEECFVNLTAPPGTIGAFTDIPRPVLGIAEPNTSPQVASDALVVSPEAPDFTTFARLSFASFNNSTGLLPCSDFGSCEITETGGIQLAGSITWFDRSDLITGTDEIFFRSDAAEVPEPSSIIAMFVVLAAFGIRLHKKASILIS